MAAQKKRGKNGYINDFQKLAEGKYAYIGKTWEADEGERRRVLSKLWGLQAVMFVASLLPGVFTTAGLLNTFYVILPYVFWVITAFALAYTLGDMTFGGNPMRDYVHARTVIRYGSLVMAPLAGAVLTALGLSVFLFRNGKTERGGGGAALCFVCCIAQIAASLAGKRAEVRKIWNPARQVR